jgi:hypothetical protein
MRKITILVTVLAALGIVSCKKDAKADENVTDTSAVVVDSVKTADMTMEDPDPTDTIPAGQYGINSSNPETAKLVALTLQDRFKDDIAKNIIDETSRKFIFFEYDLNDDGKKEIFVGLTGGYFCGSGGCTQYILDNQGAILNTFTVSDYPVVIDNNKTKEWKDLFILSKGKYHIVKFDGKKYPSNPSLLPELKVLPGDGLPRALNFLNEPYAWFKF